MAGVRVLGIGWPVAMMDALREWREAERWPLQDPPEGSRSLRFRTTDLAVNRLLLGEHQVKVWPLSVSSDKIAHLAWRAAALLTRHADETGRAVDRTGATNGVFEVYPGATLVAWGLNHRGYKGRSVAARPAARRCREDLLGGIERGAGGKLLVETSRREKLVESDDAFDALLAALAAAAASRKLSVGPSPADVEAARAEGWIHVPMAGSLERLFT